MTHSCTGQRCAQPAIPEKGRRVPLRLMVHLEDSVPQESSRELGFINPIRASS
jgi:hypothetical protein